MTKVLVDKIDAVLPQTQCRECDYDGCRPYAEAIVQNNESINRCPPGGVAVLEQLSKLTNQDATPFINEMNEKHRPPQTAVIREDECIGCTKCIDACPVDAIMGSQKLMHTVITQECTGCELCVSPCPMDCIDIFQLSEHNYFPEISRQRHESRNLRLQKIAVQERETYKSKKDKQVIQAAMRRVMEKS